MTYIDSIIPRGLITKSVSFGGQYSAYTDYEFLNVSGHGIISNMGSYSTYGGSPGYDRTAPATLKVIADDIQYQFYSLGASEYNQQCRCEASFDLTKLWCNDLVNVVTLSGETVFDGFSAEASGNTKRNIILNSPIVFKRYFKAYYTSSKTNINIDRGVFLTYVIF